MDVPKLSHDDHSRRPTSTITISSTTTQSINSPRESYRTHTYQLDTGSSTLNESRQRNQTLHPVPGLNCTLPSVFTDRPTPICLGH